MRRLFVAAIGLLVGLAAVVFFAPLVLRLREDARRAECARHLGVLATLGLDGYRQAHADTLPPGTLPEASALGPDRRPSLYADLLPQLGRGELAERLRPAEAWDAPANADAVAPVLPVLLCPSLVGNRAPISPGEAHYTGVAGLGADAPRKAVNDTGAGPFRWSEASRLRPTRIFEPASERGSLVAVGDDTNRPVPLRGLAYTAAFAETDQGIGPWAAGGAGTVRGWDFSAWPLFGPGRPLGSRHPAGSNVAFLDGSVRIVTPAVSERVARTYPTLAAEPEEVGP